MNKDVIKFLQNEINENKISHAFLIETNSSDSTLKEIGDVFQKNNLISKQTLENNISVFIIRPENNNIDKDKILELQKFTMTKSIIKNYKIYFIVNAELMNISSANKLLKVLEEPSENVIGFLLTENENLIIPTIKSRCQRFKKHYQTDENTLNGDILEMLINIKKLTFCEILDLKKQILQKEKMEIIKIINELKNQLITNDINEISTLAKYYKILDNINSLIKSNVNIELCLDKMLIEMRK
jgi:DNA polymerase III delta prime subunit